MTASDCLLVDLVLADEPAAHLESVLADLRPLVDALGHQPKMLYTVSPGGRLGRDRAFSWPTLATLAADESVGTISCHELRENAAEFTLSLYLRHNPKLPLEAQPPASIWLAIQLHGDGASPPGLADSGADWLLRASEHLAVLHGGVTLLDNISQARNEATGARADLEAQPDTFQRRRAHDWHRNDDEVRRKCRRLYWVTLLGPTLTAAAGGAEAARAAGALNVREINGSIVFQAMEGPPRDSLDPEFLAATTRLRRWLWPHTFQNPLDAAGFEAEVGVVAPTGVAG